jgi:hypothetical protein
MVQSIQFDQVQASMTGCKLQYSEGYYWNERRQRWLPELNKIDFSSDIPAFDRKSVELFHQKYIDDTQSL